jgi:hypothetical protein
LRQAGIPLHWALGNHDQREHFLTAFPDLKSAAAEASPVPNKLVSVVETSHANWFLLDSLDKTGMVMGALGESQLAWLAKELDARPNKPALVLAHHQTDPLVRINALFDTESLYNVIAPRKQVKAYIHGHTHAWHTSQKSNGLHLVTIPATAWQFDAKQPRGFVTAQLQPDGAMLTLHALDHHHPKHGEKVELKWRA